MGKLVDLARAATQEMELDTEAEVKRLVATIYDKDTPEDQAEALRHALSDPVGALECYRWILSRSTH